MKKIILPEKFTSTIISIGKRDGLINNYDFDDMSHIEGINCKLNKRFEQQFYQLLFLYDEVILTDFEFELYDLTKLSSLNNISYLDSYSQDDIVPLNRLNCIVPAIEYDFSQYIKPAVIHSIKRDMSSLYKIKDNMFSDYRFASIFYDILFSAKQEKQHMIKKYANIYDINSRYYHLHSEIKGNYARQTKFYDILLAVIAKNIDPVLRDFELAKEDGMIILDPPYSIEKLGLSSKKEKNIEEIYGTLRVECNKVIPMLPKFNSIQEVLLYREKKEKQIKTLRTEIDNLEIVLSSEGREKMIIKASEDVRKAAKELCRGEETTAIDKWSLFCALPAGLLEFYLSIPPFISLPLSVYGISSYFKKKYVSDKHGWIRIIR